VKTGTSITCICFADAPIYVNKKDFYDDNNIQIFLLITSSYRGQNGSQQRQHWAETLHCCSGSGSQSMQEQEPL